VIDISRYPISLQTATDKQ